MPKDTHGKYHPPKGKPSDTRKEETNEELRDELDETAPIAHPNRNTNKKRDRGMPRDQEQQDEPKHGRTGRELKTETGDAIVPVRMDIIEAKDLRDKFVELAKYPADVCVSIYLGAPGWEDGAPLKSALRDARKQMEEMGIVAVIDKILEPAAWLANDTDFWRSQPRGVAIFLAPDFHALTPLPYDPGSEVHVHTSFILAPLTPMVSGEGEYFVLALSQKRARLYRGNGFNMQAVDIPDMPDGTADVIQTEEKSTGGMKHGDEDKKNAELYFREVDRTLQTAGLATSSLPLLLAGVDYELSIFRNVTKYMHVMKEELAGNYDRVPLPTLAEAAHAKVAAWFEGQWRDKVRRHLDKGTAPVTSFPQDVVRAAFEGRVAQLFLAKGVLLWGKYASAPVEPVIHDAEEPGDDCLTNQLVVQTILHGGQAIVEDREKMPVEGEMVAVLRYS